MPTKIETKRGPVWVCDVCGRPTDAEVDARNCEASHHPDTVKTIWAGECWEPGCSGCTMAERDKNGKTLALFCEHCDWREVK